MIKHDFVGYALNHTWARIQRSEIHGVGVIAIRDIPQGTNIFPECAVEFSRIHVDEFYQLEDSVKKMIYDYFYVEDGWAWVPHCTLNQVNASFFLNHSENPNVIHDDAANIISNRDILSGEELTIDYGRFEKDQREFFEKD